MPAPASPAAPISMPTATCSAAPILESSSQSIFSCWLSSSRTSLCCQIFSAFAVSPPLCALSVCRLPPSSLPSLSSHQAALCSCATLSYRTRCCPCFLLRSRLLRIGHSVQEVVVIDESQGFDGEHRGYVGGVDREQIVAIRSFAARRQV